MLNGFQEGHVDDVYAPVMDFPAIRSGLACLAKGDIIHHLDVNSAILNKEMSEEDALYVRPPQDLDLALN